MLLVMHTVIIVELRHDVVFVWREVVRLNMLQLLLGGKASIDPQTLRLLWLSFEQFGSCRLLFQIVANFLESLGFGQWSEILNLLPIYVSLASWEDLLRPWLNFALNLCLLI